jgi:hypothetical protein
MSHARVPADPAASVRARLLNISRQRKSEFQLILSEFAVERLLYRLGASRHADRFILKCAMLFKVWSGVSHRATWDLDLLGRGASGVDDVVAAMREICQIAGDDVIAFDASSVEGEELAAAGENAGVRVRLEARLAGARIPVQVDVGFGDVVTPEPTRKTYPTLLDHLPPVVLTYPIEAVVAEKVEAMVSLGVTNSRMKDFYDVHVLAAAAAFDGEAVSSAIRATFDRRGTPIPAERPLVLTREFLSAPERQAPWRAFIQRGQLQAPPDGGELADALWRFLGPVLTALARGEALRGHWQSGGPWEVEEHP